MPDFRLAEAFGVHRGVPDHERFHGLRNNWLNAFAHPGRCDRRTVRRNEELLIQWSPPWRSNAQMSGCPAIQNSRSTHPRVRLLWIEPVSAHSTVPAVAPSSDASSSAKHTIPFNRPDHDASLAWPSAFACFIRPVAVVAPRRSCKSGAETCWQVGDQNAAPVRLVCIAVAPLIPRLPLSGFLRHVFATPSPVNLRPLGLRVGCV